MEGIVSGIGVGANASQYKLADLLEVRSSRTWVASHEERVILDDVGIWAVKVENLGWDTVGEGDQSIIMVLVEGISSDSKTCASFLCDEGDD